MTVEAINERSPLLSVWVQPRKTIEQIVATRPTYGVLVLVILNAMLAIAIQPFFFSVLREWLDWRVAVPALAGGGLLAVLNLYVISWIVTAIARIMDGRGSAQASRAALAWGQVPAIVGLAIALAMFGAERFVAASTSLPYPLAIDLVIIVGGLWSLAITLLMLGRVQQFGFGQTIIAYIVFPLVLLPVISVLVTRIFLFQPFNVPAGSMAPTLEVGDYFFANKFVYGYSQFSLPFGPWGFSGRILASDPKLGDVVVFALPKQPTVTYVKRVVGLAGDRVQVHDGQLLLNGTPVKREQLPNLVGEFCSSGDVATKRWRETLPNGVTYQTLDCVDNGYYDNTPEYVVPPGHVFTMGDNRDNSTDSRVLSAVGYVPLDNIFGRASMIFYSLGAGGRARPERIGTIVR